jgi:hypothetical protein
LLESMKGRGHLEKLGTDGRIILKLFLSKQCGSVWTGLIQLSVGTSDKFLQM